ncbi:hypothetical protein ACLB2K_039216 [Fragaria x ananassa]
MGASESRESSRQEGGENAGAIVALAAAAIAGLAAVVLVVARLLSGSSSSGGEKKTMKAPGRNNQRIKRDDFERDPASYFKKLRKVYDCLVVPDLYLFNYAESVSFVLTSVFDH